MILFEMVMLGCIAIFCIGMVVMMFCLAFDDTETFRAIDEKIAKLIRGEKE